MEGVDYGEGTKSYMDRTAAPDFRQTLLPTRTIQRGHRTVAKRDPDFSKPRYGDTNQSVKSAVHTSRRRVNLNQILASSKGSDTYKHANRRLSV